MSDSNDYVSDELVFRMIMNNLSVVKMDPRNLPADLEPLERLLASIGYSLGDMVMMPSFSKMYFWLDSQVAPCVCRYMTMGDGRWEIVVCHGGGWREERYVVSPPDGLYLREKGPTHLCTQTELRSLMDVKPLAHTDGCTLIQQYQNAHKLRATTKNEVIYACVAISALAGMCLWAAIMC
jgi:hypothetical protein